MKGEILTLNREDSQIPFSHVIKVNITNNKTYCPNLFQYMMYREDIWRRHWRPTPVLLPGKSHTWRSLVGCSPWGCEESDTTERLHFPFSLSCTGEGNDNPLQCSCLENPRDGGACWAAVSATQSRTQLKRLSSSSIPLHTYVYHILSTHSSVNGYLGCFHVLAFVNNAVKIGAHVSF